MYIYIIVPSYQTEGMEMISLHLTPILYVLFLIINIVLIYFLYKKKSIKMSIIWLTFVVSSSIISLFFNPIIFKQEGVSRIERVNTDYKSIDVPERVYVENQSFVNKQMKELESLKTQSTVITNDIKNKETN